MEVFYSLIIIITLATLVWLISVVITNASIVDIFWGAGFVIVNSYYYLSLEELFLRHHILMILSSIWGLRLSLYIAWRNLGKGEDYRYQNFRKSYGEKRYWWVSFFQVFLLQSILLWIISMPFYGVNFSTSSDDLFVADYVALFIWAVGMIFETGGDIQLLAFKRKSENKGKVMDKGLWKYTRHPNYFGDSMIWWSFATFSIAADEYWQIISAVIMTLLLLKVSGVSLLEKKLKDKPYYNEYIKSTNAFFPWFPKKRTK